MIYTSYFAKLRKIPSNIISIAICAKSPDWYKGLEYKKLAPKYDFFMKWKKNHDNNYYIKCFYEQVLSNLDPKDLVAYLYQLSDGKDIVLICYEKPGDFCHRHLVADWLNKNGYAIYGTRPCSPYRKDKFAYTSKGDEMYAIYLPDENDSSNTLPDTVTIPVSEKISQVFFNGNSLEFTQNDDSITVNTGAHHQTEIAYVFTLKKS